MKAKKVLIIALSVGVGLAALAVIILWGVAMPPRNLPEPSGPFAIGTISYDLIDFDREDPYAVVSGEIPGPRHIRLQLWYPADPESITGRAEPWMVDGISHIHAIIQTHGFPSFIWNHTPLMKSHSYADAAPAESADGWPLIIISHGWKGYRGLHADVAEELASHGYVVAAAEHSYGAAAVVLDDGRVLRSSPAVLPERDGSPEFAGKATRLVQTFADDDRFILQHLSRIADGSYEQGPSRLDSLNGKIDIDRVGLAGHSTGGGAMVRLVMDLTRADRDRSAGETELPAITAVLGLDPWVEPIGTEELTSGDFAVPVLILRSETWNWGDINEEYLLSFVEDLESPVEMFRISGSTHRQFSALYMYAPLSRWLGMLGETDVREFMEYQRTHILRYFDGQLKGEAYRIPEFDDLIPISVSP
jgi:hypothetical protein